jgi:hypothetical protein
MSVYEDLMFAPILITDLFRLHTGVGREKSDSGSVPYIAASFQNNGVVGYVEEAKYPGGWLSLVKDGDGGAGTCFYQPSPFWPSNHVFGLEPISDAATEAALLVMAATITHQCFPKYNRGFAANTSRLSRQKIMVPVIEKSDGNPIVNWDGMTRLGEELKATAIARTYSVRSADIADADAELPDLRFEPMAITDVFESMKASRAWYDKTKLRTAGEAAYPFVSRTKAGNSVDGFSSKQEKVPEGGNAITIGLDTQTVAYQAVPFYTSQNIQVLRHPSLNQEAALVLAACIREQMGKFSWGGNGATLGRLKKTRIMVPVLVDASGEQVVDGNGMTRYGRVVRARAERDMSVVVGVGKP